VPIEFQEEAEQLQEVSIEVDEIVFYTSDEQELESDSAESLSRNKSSFNIRAHQT